MSVRSGVKAQTVLLRALKRSVLASGHGRHVLIWPRVAAVLLCCWGADNR